eukprot:14345196-Alexandrium_andersonii.AAC.1
MRTLLTWSKALYRSRAVSTAGLPSNVALSKAAPALNQASSADRPRTPAYVPSVCQDSAHDRNW